MTLVGLNTKYLYIDEWETDKLDPHDYIIRIIEDPLVEKHILLLREDEKPQALKSLFTPGVDLRNVLSPLDSIRTGRLLTNQFEKGGIEHV